MRGRCVIGYADFCEVSKTNTVVFLSCKQVPVCIPHTANGWFMVIVGVAMHCTQFHAHAHLATSLPFDLAVSILACLQRSLSCV